MEAGDGTSFTLPAKREKSVRFGENVEDSKPSLQKRDAASHASSTSLLNINRNKPRIRAEDALGEPLPLALQLPTCL